MGTSDIAVTRLSSEWQKTPSGNVTSRHTWQHSAGSAC